MPRDCWPVLDSGRSLAKLCLYGVTTGTSLQPLLGDATKAEWKSACVPNFLSYNGGSPEELGNNLGTNVDKYRTRP
jgi:hypothetical protein